MSLGNAKLEQFCQEYIVDNNGTAAAIRAGYSPKSANSQAAQIMARIDVQIRIEELKLESNARLSITRERVIEEMARIGLSDIRKVFVPGTRRLRDVTELDDDTAAAIESIEVVANNSKGEIVDHTHKIKLAGKIAALKELGKHFNIYEDHQKSGAGEMTVIIDGKDVDL